MGKFYLHKDGYLIQTGECPDGEEVHQAFNGSLVGLGDPPNELQPKPVEVIDLVAIALYKRNTLLVESDWTQLPDVPLVTKLAWAEYRQLLRDITDQVNYPSNITWPIKPNN